MSSLHCTPHEPSLRKYGVRRPVREPMTANKHTCILGHLEPPSAKYSSQKVIHCTSTMIDGIWWAEVPHEWCVAPAGTLLSGLCALHLVAHVVQQSHPAIDTLSRICVQAGSLHNLWSGPRPPGREPTRLQRRSMSLPKAQASRQMDLGDTGQRLWINPLDACGRSA